MENNHKITQMLELADYAFGTTIRNLKWIMWGGISWETGIDIYTLLYIKQRTNKDLLQSTGNSTQSSVMGYRGKESKKEWIYVYAQLIHFAVHLKLTQHCKSTVLQ